MALDRPIFLVGAARSGTKIIGQTLATHAMITFWDEPKYVWRHGHHAAESDFRSPDEATDGVTRFIRRQFEQYLEKSGRPRFLEKTPSNCFRIAFIHRIFPDGLFLHVQRDGRDVAASAIQRWCSKPDDGAIARRLRGWEIPLGATHHYLPDILREMFMRRFWPERGYVWGPRYPGLNSDLAHGMDIATLCAKQWAESERYASRDLGSLPDGQVLHFRYEDFVSRPQEMLTDILHFVDLPSDESVIRAADALRAESIGTHRTLPPAQRDAIEAICLPVMRDLGLDI